ncbi:MAG: prenyltransferase/squalene oxidase repeat-containing protein [Verrucomicrobiota bacterium]
MMLRLVTWLSLFVSVAYPLAAQGPLIRFGEKVSPEVDHMMERGLEWLLNHQHPDGYWEGDRGAGVTGLCVMAFLASGEDPNFGLYRRAIRLGLRRIILEQESETGYLGQSMYHHGFGMLALAEAYGAVDDRFLWDGTEDPSMRRSIGQSLEQASQLAMVSQQNNRWGGWRYNPQTNDADTSVSGAVLMGLLAARNAGLDIPDNSVETALSYFKGSTGATGMVAYTGGLAGVGESMNRSAIATLVYAVGEKKDWREYKATLRHISTKLEHQESGHPQYFRYYMAQALFQGDFESWQRWNRELIRFLKQNQLPDGSFSGSRGTAYGTAMSLLAIALNYRFLPIYERQ